MSADPKLIFCPIQMDPPNITLDSLAAFHAHFSFLHWSQCWQVAPVVGFVDEISNWHDSRWQKEAWIERYSQRTDSPIWTPQLSQYFPDLKEFLARLPFARINYCVILKQLKEVPAHFDLDPVENEQLRTGLTDYEPLLYKLKYQDSIEKSFYMTPFLSAEKRVFPESPSPLFVISESHWMHGAKKVGGQEKYVISIFGNLKLAEHRELIERNRRLFKNFVVEV